MSKVQDVLRPFWLRGLNEVSKGTTQSFKGWITGQNYLINGFIPAGNIIEIHPFRFDAVVSALAHDIDRFGAATFETIAGIGAHKEVPRSRAWALIRSYYAAFYAAHALSRVFGRSVSNLGADEASALRQTAAASGLVPGPFAVLERIYLFEANASLGTVTATPLDKGPHQDTWKVFDGVLTELQRLILSGHALKGDAQEVFGCLQNIRDILNHNQSRGNWLSTIRNNLSYRHDYGAWFPHGAGRQWTQVDALFRAFLTDPLSSGPFPQEKIIVRFVRGCAMIVSLYTEVMQDLRERHPDGRSFLLERAVPVMRVLSAL